MALIAQLELTLLRYINTVPSFIAVDALRDALQDFCKATFAWQHRHDITHDVQGLYDLELPPQTLINNIVAASLDGKPLVQGQDFDFATPSQIRITTRPGALSVLVSLYPNSQATELPDALFERFRNAIAQKAAADLGMMQNMDWSLPGAMVEQLRRDSQRGYSEARSYALDAANRLYEAQTRHQFF